MEGGGGVWCVGGLFHATVMTSVYVDCYSIHHTGNNRLRPVIISSKVTFSNFGFMQTFSQISFSCEEPSPEEGHVTRIYTLYTFSLELWVTSGTVSSCHSIVKQRNWIVIAGFNVAGNYFNYILLGS